LAFGGVVVVLDVHGDIVEVVIMDNLGVRINSQFP